MCATREQKAVYQIGHAVQREIAPLAVQFFRAAILSIEDQQRRPRLLPNHLRRVWALGQRRTTRRQPPQLLLPISPHRQPPGRTQI
jgi:hypothetical protein